MKIHPIKGETLLKPLRSIKNVLPIIRHHHECWNGEGYPDGLKREAIPFLARVFQLVDIFDALTNKRPYKKALSLEKSLIILEEESLEGKRDMDLTFAFVQFIKTEKDLR